MRGSIPKPNLEAEFTLQLRSLGFKEGIDFIREYKFHPTRKWRLDFAFIERKIAIEIEGGTYARGKSRHTTGAGYGADCVKYNELILLGWVLLRGDSKMVRDCSLLSFVERAMARKI